MVITVIPIFLIYPFMQKYFAKCCMDISFGVPGPHSISLSAYAAASSRVLFFLLAPDSRQYSGFSCIQLSISSYMIFDLLLIPSISEPRQEGRTSPWNFAPLKHALLLTPRPQSILRYCWMAKLFRRATSCAVIERIFSFRRLAF